MLSSAPALTPSLHRDTRFLLRDAVENILDPRQHGRVVGRHFSSGVLQRLTVEWSDGYRELVALHRVAEVRNTPLAPLPRLRELAA